MRMSRSFPPPPRAPSTHTVRCHAATDRDRPTYRTLASTVGQTPLVRLQRLNPNPSNEILLKLEGNNPAGSVKDRPALSMITRAEERGEIKPGDKLIEATSGNTGIALAMAAAIKGYDLTLIMPSNMTEERKASMAAYGATLIDVPPGDMEAARDLALQMQKEGKGRVLDQVGGREVTRRRARGVECSGVICCNPPPPHTPIYVDLT